MFVEVLSHTYHSRITIAFSFSATPRDAPPGDTFSSGVSRLSQGTARLLRAPHHIDGRLVDLFLRQQGRETQLKAVCQVWTLALGWEVQFEINQHIMRLANRVFSSYPAAWPRAR